VRRELNKHKVFYSLIFLAFAVGFILRFCFLASHWRQLDSDESIVALMALQISKGHWFTFYWGQSYGGTQEQLIFALLFKIFGYHEFFLRLVPLVVFSLSTYLLFVIVRAISTVRNALLAAAFLWCGSATTIWWSMKVRGFYSSLLLFSLLLVLLAIRITSSPRTREVVFFAFLLGFSIWANPEILIIGLPLCFWIYTSHKLRGKEILYAGFACVIGGLPVVIYAINNSFAEVLRSPSEEQSTYFHRLWLLISVHLPIMWGYRLPLTFEWIWGVFGKILFTAVLVLFLWILLRARKKTTVPVLLLVVVYFLMTATFSLVNNLDDGRYLLFIIPILCLVWAIGLPESTKSIALIFAMVLAVSSSSAMIDLANHAGPTYAQAPTSALINELNSKHVSNAWADYWIAYRITLDSHQKIISDPISSSRYRPYRERVARSKNPPVVVFRNSTLSRLTSRFLDKNFYSFRRVDVRNFSVFYVNKSVDPKKLAKFWGSSN
jgi:hypothetical protein